MELLGPAKGLMAGRTRSLDARQAIEGGGRVGARVGRAARGPLRGQRARLRPMPPMDGLRARRASVARRHLSKVGPNSGRCWIGRPLGLETLPGRIRRNSTTPTFGRFRPRFRACTRERVCWVIAANFEFVRPILWVHISWRGRPIPGGRERARARTLSLVSLPPASAPASDLGGARRSLRCGVVSVPERHVVYAAPAPWRLAGRRRARRLGAARVRLQVVRHRDRLGWMSVRMRTLEGERHMVFGSGQVPQMSTSGRSEEASRFRHASSKLELKASNKCRIPIEG